jgi:hypothetical protein
MYQAFLRANARIDYEKIAEHMKATNRTWIGVEDPNGFPSVAELKATVGDLFNSVMASDRDNTRSSSGGFIVCKWTWAPGSVEIEIIFAFDRASSCVEFE